METLIPPLEVHPDEKTLCPTHSLAGNVKQIKHRTEESDESDLPDLSQSEQEKIDALFEHGKRLVTPAQITVQENVTKKGRRISQKEDDSKKQKISNERKNEGENLYNNKTVPFEITSIFRFLLGIILFLS